MAGEPRQGEESEKEGLTGRTHEDSGEPRSHDGSGKTVVQWEELRRRDV